MEQPARLHGPQVSQANNRRIRRVLLRMGAATLVAAAAIVWSLIWRDNTHMHSANETPSQIATIGISLVWGFGIIFYWSMKLTPLLRYRRHLADVRSGLNRVEEGAVVRFDEDASFREGLSFLPMLITVGDPKNPEDERLLYWDPRLPSPDVAPGDRVRLLAHGNDIIGFERLP